MNILVYFSPEHLSNSYVIFEPGTSAALLVDPRAFDVPLFKLVESRKLEIRGVLLTHSNPLAFQAIRTIRRIYDAEIFGGSDMAGDMAMCNVAHQGRFDAGGHSIEVLRLPGLHSDSLFYKLDDALFTGDALSAGTMAAGDMSYGRAIMIHQTREILEKLPPETRVYPLHGPPSTVGIENGTNIDLLADENPD